MNRDVGAALAARGGSLRSTVTHVVADLEGVTGQMRDRRPRPAPQAGIRGIDRHGQLCP
jgi:hypothetical protein